MAHQLAASIPAGHPGTDIATDLACQLGWSLGGMFSMTSLHKLPLPAAHTGPQLALQVIPSPLRPSPHVQGAQSQQQPQWYSVTPATDQLMTQLLPLLSSVVLTRMQQQQQQQQQGHQMQRADWKGRAVVVQGCNVGAAADHPHKADAVAMTGSVCSACPSPSCTPRMLDCLSKVCHLLLCAVVPAPHLTAAEVQAAASAEQYAHGHVSNTVWQMHPACFYAGCCLAQHRAGCAYV